MNIEEFVQIDKRITDAIERQADAESLRAEAVRDELHARWEFGKQMLAERKGKQLPKGRLDELVEATGKSRSELQYRMQFAERYPTEEKVSSALDTFTSWRQVQKSLPKSETAPKPKPLSPPKPNPKREEIVDLAAQGKSRREISAETGVSERQVRHELEEAAIAQAALDEAQAEAIDYATAPMSAQAKVDGMVRRRNRELEKEFRTRLLAEVDQIKAKLNADVAAYKAQLDEQDRKIRASRDEERRRYQTYIEVARAKGLITESDYNLIRSCLHPDSRQSVSDEKLAAAFRVFNDPRIKALLVKEV